MEVLAIAKGIATYVQENPRHDYSSDGWRLRALCKEKLKIYTGTLLLGKKIEVSELLRQVKALLGIQPSMKYRPKKAVSIKGSLTTQKDPSFAEGKKFSFMVH